MYYASRLPAACSGAALRTSSEPRKHGSRECEVRAALGTPPEEVAQLYFHPQRRRRSAPCESAPARARETRLKGQEGEGRAVERSVGHEGREGGEE